MFARHKNLLPIILIIVAACAAYLPTVMPEISASPNPYLRDVGNNQNALSRWGTLHGSGYPLYSLAGAAFTTTLRSVGLAPAAATGLFSAVWGIAALVVLYISIVTWLDDQWGALAAVGLLGLNWVYWLHSSIAEVYTLTTFIIVTALWLAVKADQTKRTVYLYGLAVCCGMTIAHHRALLLMLPAPLLIALPAFHSALSQRKSFAFKWIGLALVTGFVPYAYLYLRAQQPGAWLFGNPTTPEGFWRQVFGEAYASLITWPGTLSGWRELFTQVTQVWLEMLTWPIALLGLTGIIVMFVRRHYRYGLALLSGIVLTFVFAISVQASFVGVIIEDVPALLQTAVLFALLAFAYLLSELRGRSVWPRRLGLAVSAAICLFMVAQNRSVVYDLTHDTTARQIIRNAQNLIAETPAAAPLVFFSPWGGEFWALAYARDISGELSPNFYLLPNRAKLANALNNAGRLYVFSDTFYRWNLDWWRKRLHGQVYLSSAGNGVVALATHPVLSEQDLPGHNTVPIAMGDSAIVLRDWAVKSLGEGKWQISLYWQASTKPAQDYSVYIHASDHPAITEPENIVAQDDAGAPVDGWYPTSLWSPGEIVRDDSVITSPPDKLVKIIEVGLYTRDDAGHFQNFGHQVIPLP